jgi:hypothetical protein
MQACDLPDLTLYGKSEEHLPSPVQQRKGFKNHGHTQRVAGLIVRCLGFANIFVHAVL